MLKNFTLNQPSVQNQTLIYLSIKVDKSKTDQLRQGDEVIIAHDQSEGNVFPVFLFKE